MAETRYVKSGDVSIAYRVQGSGDLTMISVPGAISNMALEDLIPGLARVWERLGRIFRLVRFDKRGTGLSDRSASDMSIADQVPDVEAVRAAIGADKVVLAGLSQGAAVSILYALAHPDRVLHLILLEGVVCDAFDPTLPTGPGNRLLDWDEFFGQVDTNFAEFSRYFADVIAPGSPPEAMVDFLQATASPGTFRRLWEGIVGLDLRDRLKELSIPTLVVHASGDRHHPVSHGRFFGEHISGARYLEINSDSHLPLLDEKNGDEIMCAYEEFATGRVEHTAARRFATVLFTDIVDSTAQQQRRGDEAWKELIAVHHADAGRLVTQFGGRVVEVLGDGVLAEFPAPGEGLRAARALCEAAEAQGLRVRAGLHAGEVYEVGDRLLGICVNTASRIADRAEPGEVLASELLRGLVEGSGFEFADAGEQELKGIGKRVLLRLVGG